MSKFDKLASKAKKITFTSPVKTVRRALTHEGGPAYERDAKSELFLLAVSNLVGEDTFYESATGRDERYRELVHAVVAEDPEWVARFVPWLRGTAFLRSASVVAAAEYVRAGGPGGRRVVDSALQRADEPAEVLAYWTTRYGRALPQPVKRGVADAVRRLYGERAALKYDGQSRAWRMADVVELVHPKPRDDAQSALFRWLLDSRHDRDGSGDPAYLPMLAANAELRAMAQVERHLLLTGPDAPRLLAKAGMTWEALSGWLDGPMDATAWEAMIPSMGYMALLRNLRNFDEAEVSDEVAATVAAKLADPDEVRRSKQFPFRFVAAYRNAPSLRWGHALERALEVATSNVPVFGGRTLVLVDTSASMTGRAVSRRSSVTPLEAAAVFGVTLAKRGNAVDLYGFADGVFEHRVKKSAAVLTEVERFSRRVGEVGHGTRMTEALRATYTSRHDRVVLVSDMQAFPGSRAPAWGHSGVATDAVPREVPVYAFNLNGYAPTAVAAGELNRHEFGGLNDATFTLLDLVERQSAVGWPF